MKHGVCVSINLEESPICKGCGCLTDNYKCVCPYCGEASGCDCCVGYGRALDG